jgi:hypothetical protein
MSIGCVKRSDLTSCAHHCGCQTNTLSDGSVDLMWELIRSEPFWKLEAIQRGLLAQGIYRLLGPGNASEVEAIRVSD